MATFGSSWTEDKWKEDDGPIFGGSDRHEERMKARERLLDEGIEVTKESVDAMIERIREGK
jgi:hypothetical protein